MALSDIIERIEADAAAEASAIIAAGDERAEAILAVARAKAEASAETVLAAAKRDAMRDAETIVVNARLRGRDELVAAQRALIDEALAAAAQQIAELPDAEYARFLAKRIAAAARGRETISFGCLDVSRAEAVLAAVREIAPGLDLVLAQTPAPFERGAWLQGSRVRADLSLGTIVNDRSDELELVAAATLFSEGA